MSKSERTKQRPSPEARRKRFVFHVDLVEPLVMRTVDLRTEREWVEDERRAVTAAGFVESLIRCFAGKVYFATSGQAEVPSRIRSRKGLLHDDKTLREVPHLEGEVEVDSGKTRLYAVADVTGIDMTKVCHRVLSWTDGLLLLSDAGLEQACEDVLTWVPRDAGWAPPSSFVHARIAETLKASPSTAVFRYFPSWNRAPEMMAAVGPERFVDARVTPCMRAIERSVLDAVDDPIARAACAVVGRT